MERQASGTDPAPAGPAAGAVLLRPDGSVAGASGAALALLAPGTLEGILARLGGPGAGGPGACLPVEAGPGRTLACSWQDLGPGGSVLLLLDPAAAPWGAAFDPLDPLTGLQGRTALRAALARALGGPGRPPQPVALLGIDLDRFKLVNDTLGHPMGDALLQKVADRLRGIVRDGGVVARLGGDEFMILLPGADGVAAAPGVAARVVEVAGRPYAIGGHILNIGASVGLALAPRDGTDPDDLIKKADLALYDAKAGGRGCVRAFAPALEARLNDRRLLELDLRRAMALRQFRLAYQPQMDLGTGRITGFEALLRWDHPDRGPIPPADFIPLAEEIGLIVPLGDWVLRTACEAAAAWPAPVGVAVNLSAGQFRSPSLLDGIGAALARSGLAPSRLELEITESALLQDTDAVLEVLGAARRLGVRVSMDDFGTGYSSLSYLQRFPFDKIKIDQSFVRDADAETCADKQAIVRAIAGLGLSLGMRTTAEGVETPDQLERMRREGCTEVQGFLTGRPLPPEEAAALLRDPHPFRPEDAR